jgi:hypothetical protein
MTCAVPSWALLELLDDDPKAKAFLAAKEETLHARLGRDGNIRWENN